MKERTVCVYIGSKLHKNHITFNKYIQEHSYEQEHSRDEIIRF